MHPETNTLDRQSLPSIKDGLIFRAKTTIFQFKRLIENSLTSVSHKLEQKNSKVFNELLAESKTDLWHLDEQQEIFLQLGKVHNLRVALRNIDGVIVPAGEIFSFWAQLGRPTKSKGYVYGRELREGCLIPSVGGGLCQLSNGLYDAALSASFQIVERHAHTKMIAGSLAEIGRDATVFWNYVDLRFRSQRSFQISAYLTKDHLVIQYWAEAKQKRHLRVITQSDTTNVDSVNSCASCGQHSCFRNVEDQMPKDDISRTAYLVDEYWPEFDKYITAKRVARDLLALPIDGKRFNRANYAWSTTGFAQIHQSFFQTIQRSIASRNIARQGAMRQRTLLKEDERLAASYGQKLGYDVTHVVVMQNLLPFLWRDGHLGGRTFDVLMTRLPMQALHDQLDRAHQLHADSATLGDFRADKELIRLEQEALKHAEKIITPHTEIAGLFPEKAELLDWQLPKVEKVINKGDKIVFPAATAGRKGAYELRLVAKELKLKIKLTGSQLEGKEFWQEIETERNEDHWLAGVGLVVLPAYIEDKPRKLLEALARGIPIIATTCCGIKAQSGITLIPPGDATALRQAIENLMNKSLVW